MTADELRIRFPNASEQFVRANCGGATLLPARPRQAQPAKPSARVKTAVATPTRKSKGNGTSGPKAPRVPRTRNGGSQTEASYWGHLRSVLRRGFRFWRPAQAALRTARIAAPGPRGRKWLFLCAGCGRMHLRKRVQIDHKIPVGALTSLDHVAGFIARMTPEDAAAFQILCMECHKTKTRIDLERK